MRTDHALSFLRSCLAVAIFFWLAVATFPGSAAADVVLDLGRGPVTVHVPQAYDPAEPSPLVMFLHGYGPGINGEDQGSFVGIPPWADELGWLYVAPDGTEDPDGILMWNATDACCDFFGSGVDDSGYLRSLIEAVIAELSVDTERIFIIGGSAGGFMAHRMACDHADLIAAVVSIAGATWEDPAMCAPSDPIRVLQIHGSEDVTVGYEGGENDLVPYPGAVETTARWAALNGCSTEPNLSWPALNLADDQPGFETTVARHDGCDPGGAAELWTMVGADHGSVQSADAVPLSFDFLLAGDHGGALLNYRSFVPAAAYAAGDHGAFFQTDIDVSNSGGRAEWYRLLWLPRGEMTTDPIGTQTFVISAGASVRHVNAVHELLGLDHGAVGAIVVEASSPNLLFMSRTYTLDAGGGGGTYGQAVPAVPERDMISDRDRHFLVFGTESDDYRTNVGCLSSSHVAVLVELELRDEQGTSLAVSSLPLLPWSPVQVNRAFADHSPVRGSIVVRATAGTAASAYTCYASVVDNTTNDPTTILPQRGGY